MNIFDFDDYIDALIVERGWNYFFDDHILSVEEADHHAYYAKVSGSEIYTVEATLDDNGEIIDTACNCPYTTGEYCKHQTALFFMLRNRWEQAYPTPPDSKKTTIKKKTNIREILAARAKKELVDFLVDCANENDDLRLRIEMTFFDRGNEEEIKQAEKAIKQYIQTNTDRSGFADYKHCYAATKGAELVMDKAVEALEKRKFSHAVNLSLCVIHHMMELLHNADDSDGFVGGKIDDAIALVREIAQNKGLKTNEKTVIFTILTDEAKNHRYDHWDHWRFNLISGCAELVYNQEMRDQCEALLSGIADDNDEPLHLEYINEQINLIRYKMVVKLDGPTKAREYIEDNLRYSSFRKLAMDQAMRDGDYELVERLALQGEKADSQMAGLVKKWKTYRYIAYQKSGQMEKQRALAMEFIVAGSFEHYLELKRTYIETEWTAVYPHIITQIENRDKMRYFNYVYASILVEENEKRKLCEYMKKIPSQMMNYYQSLLPEFQEEVYEIFTTHIVQCAADSHNRMEYRKVCAIIRHLKKAGGKEQAEMVKQRLLDAYPRRPAFRDELSRV